MTKPLSGTELKRLHRSWRRQGDLRLALILDGVQNPFNVGSIFRSAAAYRTEQIWMVPPTVELPSPKVAKTALGCERLVSTQLAPNGPAAVTEAKAAGFTTVAVELTEAASPLFRLPLSGPICLVLGHEERGVKADTLAVVDHIGFLPLVGKVGSLNVAHATTAALAEASRQFWSSLPEGSDTSER